MGQIGSPETSVLNQPTLRNIPEDGSIQISMSLYIRNIVEYPVSLFNPYLLTINPPLYETQLYHVSHKSQYNIQNRKCIKYSKSYSDDTQWHFTVGRTPLDEWSARRRELYLTKHNTHKRQTSMPPAVFEPIIPASDRPQTLALDRSTNEIVISVL